LSGDESNENKLIRLNGNTQVVSFGAIVC